MYSCTDCEKNVCNERAFLGHDCLERCSRCHASHDRAGRGAPPPSGHHGGGCGGDGSIPRPPPGPDLLVEGKGPLDILVAQLEVAVRLPGDMLEEEERPFSGTVADSHGAGSNQCGSSFYGPA